MIERVASAALAAALLASPTLAQSKKAANSIDYDVTVMADGKPYTGTMTLAINAGKATGDIHITAPSEITGKVAGTSKGGRLALDFIYRMIDRGCEGQIVMTIALPEKKTAAPATGTADIAECGDPAAPRIQGTVELKPKAAPKK